MYFTYKHNNKSLANLLLYMHKKYILNIEYSIFRKLHHFNSMLHGVTKIIMEREVRKL